MAPSQSGEQCWAPKACAPVKVPEVREWAPGRASGDGGGRDGTTVRNWGAAAMGQRGMQSGEAMLSLRKELIPVKGAECEGAILGHQDPQSGRALLPGLQGE